MIYKVLLNPLAGTTDDTSFHAELQSILEGDTLECLDITKTDIKKLLTSLKKGEGVILVGGDGTLNRFVNEVNGVKIKAPVYYYAGGSGNDFWTDIGAKKGEKPVDLTKYIANLPTVEVKGKSYKFINGVGYGIDGYCCEVGDKLKAAGKDKINYAGIAIKGLLFHFKPANAEITVDGVTKTFKKVWIAPAMNGRYYGGGMMPTPNQDRLSPDHTLSICVFHGSGKLKTLMIFPSLFKGEHVKKTKNVTVLTGKKITVKFDKPCALQIDGETILAVSEYTATAAE
ncbi:MAG: diacylglycerol/lipid kinase family protein [Candidatus Coproplasma sp.]